ncbi:Uma2 family endonuclease [Spirulina sp. CS-785/01]|uniref:Uma2 family endonuclease n=1 Tax=Spirulina sp. CS-785/01 TaxID=3021716 RepID=UPI00232E1DA8|nr:Uma2 family endonuclease [Spirulina sp. CS-785/01]MDB9311931.1 Uma2 family endonuclease [Spirulina sp. CS-785/01]
MAGGTLSHNAIALNLAAFLKSHLRGKLCQTYIADAKVGISQQGPFYYPDVMVTCDVRDRQEQKVVYHPCLIAKVLSSKTEGRDRGVKFRNYRRLDTLTEYILINTEFMNVELYRRNDNQKWELTTYSPEDNREPPDEITIPLFSVALSLLLSTLYEDIIFSETSENTDNLGFTELDR